MKGQTVAASVQIHTLQFIFLGSLSPVDALRPVSALANIKEILG